MYQTKNRNLPCYRVPNQGAHIYMSTGGENRIMIKRFTRTWIFYRYNVVYHVNKLCKDNLYDYITLFIMWVETFAPPPPPPINKREKKNSQPSLPSPLSISGPTWILLDAHVFREDGTIAQTRARQTVWPFWYGQITWEDGTITQTRARQTVWPFWYGQITWEDGNLAQTRARQTVWPFWYGQITWEDGTITQTRARQTVWPFWYGQITWEHGVSDGLSCLFK